jgi:hypothetical protein
MYQRNIPVPQLAAYSFWFFAWLTFDPKDVPLKYWFLSKLHGITTQRTVFFIVNIMRT